LKNIINILSPEVINQIAAGEVIQRPASVLKELLENSIDAKSKNIEIIIENAGKTLIKVVDDGNGMNELDANICFQKHTTSKIQKTEDIMSIVTMGFRGEALSSIASIANVELQTKTCSDKIGTLIHVDNSQIKSMTKIATKKGSVISVKNLFFNIPARRNFLKSDKIEMKYLLESFMQISIAHHQISFKLKNNGKVIYNLSATNLKQRVIQLFGKRYNEKILPIKEKTSIVSITGFLGNPIEAKKTRGEQFLYVNRRFIKSSYLNHAIKAAMDSIIIKEQYPSYFIFLEISPKLIDINIHPNKIEVKFEDEKAIYKILKSACKRSIGIHNITPSLDFATEESFEIPTYIQKSIPKEPKLKINTSFNPFKENTNRHKENFEKLFEEKNDNIIKNIMNINNHYAVFVVFQNNIHTVNIIDKQRSLQRITYEQTQKILKNKKVVSQKITNPYKIELNNIDIELFKDNQELLTSLGYTISKITSNYVEISTIPSGLDNHNLQELFELFLEELKHKNTDIESNIIEKTARKITHNTSLKTKDLKLSNEYALQALIKNLLKCENPFIGIDGKPCVINIEPNNFFN